MSWIGALSQPVLKIGHLLEDVSDRQSGETGILRTTLAIRKVTVSAGKHFWFAPHRHNPWHRWMKGRMPVRHLKHVGNFQEREGDRTSRNTLRRFILDSCPFTRGLLRRIDCVSPIGRSLPPRLRLSRLRLARGNNQSETHTERQPRRNHRNLGTSKPLRSSEQKDNSPPSRFPAAQNLPRKLAGICVPPFSSQLYWCRPAFVPR